MADSIVTINKSKINSYLPSEFIFLCFASFEQRSTTIPLSINISSVSNAIVFKSVNTDNDAALKEISSKFTIGKIVELDLTYPIGMARALTEVIKSFNDLAPQNIVIDITTFTHEVLSMLLKLIYDNKIGFASITCLYNGASDYSDSKVAGLNQMWLSKGCSDVRNIIGYPGRMRPISKTCLIILTGYELERATRLIEFLEPDKLAIGIGVDPTHDNHTDAMTFFHKKFNDWKLNYKNNRCFDFEFSCKDIEKTVSVLTELMDQNPDDNYIVVPLNTKLSTIAVLITSLQNTNVQVCYSVPEVYNTKNYSSPSDNIIILELNKIGIFSQYS